MQVFLFPSARVPAPIPPTLGRWAATRQRDGRGPAAPQGPTEPPRREAVPTTLLLGLMNNSDHRTVGNYGIQGQSLGICFKSVNPQERKSLQQTPGEHTQKAHAPGCQGLCLRGRTGGCGAEQSRRRAAEGTGAPQPAPVNNPRWMGVPAG